MDNINETLLRKQAEKKREKEQRDEETLKVVSFKIGEEHFAFDIVMVREINRMLDITRVPKAKNFVDGVINLRGRVIPVLNMRKRIGLNHKDYDNDTKIIVIEKGKKTIGFIVDSVSEVLKIPKSTIEPPPSIMGEMDTEYISGVGKLKERLIALIDLDKLIL